MFASFEYSGLWWLPQRPDHRVAGTIRYSIDTGAILQLIGRLWEESPNSSDAPIPIILGLTSNGRVLTLLRSLLLRESFSAPGLSTMQIYSHFVLEG